jgi:hypothetical protein
MVIISMENGGRMQIELDREAAAQHSEKLFVFGKAGVL